METRVIRAIKVGERFRKDLGNLDSLKASIEKNGLLQPVVIDKNSNLVAGERRMEAYKQLGHDTVPVQIVDPKNPLQAQHDENVCRKDFTVSEKVAIVNALLVMETEAAAKRMKAGKKHREDDERGPSGKFPEGRGEAKAKAAAAVGIDRKTYEKGNVVVKLAAENPEEFEEIKEEMDRTGKVDPAFRKAKEKNQRGKKAGKKAERPEELPALTPQEYVSRISGTVDGAREQLESVPAEHWNSLTANERQTLRRAADKLRSLAAFLRKVCDA